MRASSRAGSLLLLLAVAAGAETKPSPAARRAELLKLGDRASLDRLKATLADRDRVVARTAARLLTDRGTKALPALGGALKHDDALLRRIVALGLASAGPAGVPLLKSAVADPEALVRSAAVVSLARLRPRDAVIEGLLNGAAQDGDVQVREAALLALRSGHEVVWSQALPAEGWKFRPDPDQVGEQERWFTAELDESAWKDIAIERFWQDFGYGVLGVAWYRRSFTLPVRPEAERFELVFGAVDESTWVWLNGQPAGVHDIGPSGWDKEFALDVSKGLRWGGANKIAVRVYNTAQAGGIWKPVTLRGLRRVK